MRTPRPLAARPISIISLIAMILTFLVFGQPTAQALPTAEYETILTEPGGVPGDNFGGRVSVAGDTALVTVAGDSGSEARIYRLAGGAWELEGTLASALPDDFMTRATLSESGDAAVLTGRDAPFDGILTALVFERTGSTWTEVARLTPDNSPTSNSRSVAMSDDTIVFGDEQGSGSAVVFARTEGIWSQQARLTSNATTICCGAGTAQFGSVVAISGDTIVVGAPSDESSGNRRGGSATVYARTAGAWSQQVKLQGAPGAGFGYSVAVSGDTAVIGATGEDAAYVHGRTAGTWTQDARLTGGTRGANIVPVFGASVAVDGDTIVVGTQQRDDRGQIVGSAYVFVLVDGIWAEQPVLTASDSVSENAYFGNTVDVSGGNAVVGANGTDGRTGTAYVYRLTDTGAATSFGDGVATLNGLAAPEGVATEVHFRYGTDPSLATGTDTPVQSIGAGPDLVGVNAALAGLTNDTTYYHQLVVTNSTGTFVGATRSFFLGARITVEQPAASPLDDGTSTVDYGRTTFGDDRTKTFTVGNTGQVDLELATLTVDGPNASDFVIGAPGSTTVADGDTTTFDVTFTPGAEAPRSATLHIVSNSAGPAGSFDIELSGLGTQPEVWTGPPVTITRDDFADPYAEVNQDRVTDNVWLTREFCGPWNAVTEDYTDCGGYITGAAISPAGTEWAFGSAADWQSLTFTTWTDLLGLPADPVGKPLVLRLIHDNIYLDVVFTDYADDFRSDGRGNGYTYIRSTPSLEPTDETPPETAITDGPDDSSDSTDATFIFDGTDDLSDPSTLTFECTLDGGVAAPCTSPVTVTSLADGSHTFTVTATDEAGNTDPTPATFTWTVDTPNPPPSKDACKANGWESYTDDQGAAFRNQGDCVAYVATGGTNKAGDYAVVDQELLDLGVFD